MFRELTEDAHYSKGAIWDMLLECWAIMIEEMASARSAVVDSARIEPCLYDIKQLKCWMIQQCYEENNFGDNSAFTGVMVKRILMHSEDTGFKKHLDALENFQTKYNEQHCKDQVKVKKIAADLKKHMDKPTHRGEPKPPANVLPTLKQYGNEVVGFLKALYLLHEMHITVVSDDGWCWVIAWAQLGVRKMTCVATMKQSKQQLDLVTAVLGGMLEATRVDSAEAWPPASDMRHVV